MRTILRALALVSATSACGCDGEAVPPAQAPSVQAPPGAAAVAPEAPGELLSRLRGDNPAGLLAAAQGIAARGDEATRRAAAAQLVAQARVVGSPAFREWRRSLRLGQPADRIEARLDHDRDRVLGQILAAMEAVGGDAAVSYCLSVGEDEAAPVHLRKAALAVLVRHADRGDASLRARSAAIWERVGAAPARPRAAVGSMEVGHPTLRGATVANVEEVIAGMGSGFRRCFDWGLQEDPSAAGSIQVTAHIGASGTVSSVEEVHADLSPHVVACVTTRVAAAVFGPPQGAASATLVIPLRFEAE